MNFIKRWTTAVSASFDTVMTQVENHDALVSAALREMQTAGAKAKVQLSRVKKDGEQMRRRHEELKEMERLWEERAVRSNAEEKEKAIECLRRRNAATRERKYLEEQLKQHEQISIQLSRDLKLIDERIQELRRKQSTLNARQYRAEALKAGQLSELGLIGEIDDIFDRWEVKLTQYENFSVPEDEFETTLKKEEDDRDLSAELERLIQAQAN